eukprot:761747-Hanusia_phi.AAC.6
MDLMDEMARRGPRNIFATALLQLVNKFASPHALTGGGHKLERSERSERLRFKAAETLRTCTPVKLQLQACAQLERFLLSEGSWDLRLAVVDALASFFLPITLVRAAEGEVTVLGMRQVREMATRLVGDAAVKNQITGCELLARAGRPGDTKAVDLLCHLVGEAGCLLCDFSPPPSLLLLLRRSHAQPHGGTALSPSEELT